MFKLKPDKTKNQEKIVTLDETHKNTVKKFEQERQTVDQKKKQIEELKQSLKTFETREQKNLTLDDIKEKTNMKLKIEQLQNEINDTLNSTTELDYYSRVDNILMQYYNILDNTDVVIPQPTNQLKVPESRHKHVRKRGRITTNSQDILSFFNTTPSPPSENTNKEDIDSPKEKRQVITNRVTLFDQYMKIVNNNLPKRNKELTKYCDKCKQERVLIQTDGIYVCSKCGEVENALIESDIPNYKDSVTEKPSYPYRKSNHATELISVI